MILSNVLLTFRRNRNKGNDHLSFSPVSTQFFHPFIKHRPSPPEANQLGILPPNIRERPHCYLETFSHPPPIRKTPTNLSAKCLIPIIFLVKFITSGEAVLLEA